MDRVPTRILERVAAKHGENPCRRRGKGSLAMFVSQGLVDPKVTLNRSYRMGNRLIFLYQTDLCLYCWIGVVEVHPSVYLSVESDGEP